MLRVSVGGVFVMCEGQSSMSGVILNIYSEIRFIIEHGTY